MVVDDVSAGIIREWLIQHIVAELRIPLEDADPQATFASLGMDSLTLLTLTGDLAEWMNRDLPASLLNNHPTIDSLARHLAREEPDGSAYTAPALCRSGGLPVTFSQERLLRYAEWGDAGDSNLVVERFSVRGDLDRAALEGAINDIVQRHEILRTTFEKAEHGFAQRVHETRPVMLETFDFSDDEHGEDRAFASAAREAAQPMRLQAGPLLRALVFKLAESGHHGVMFIFHHLLVDADALHVFHGELNHFYALRRGGSSPALPELKLQVADFAAWERQWLGRTGAPYQTRLAWWRQYWSGAMPEPVKLPMRRHEPPEVTPSPDECHCSRVLPRAFADEVAALARKENTTPHVVFFAAFTAFLHVKTHQEDFVIGSYVSDRKRMTARSLIGMFASMVAVRVRLEGAPTFRDWVAQLGAQNDQVILHQELPFEDLLDSLNADSATAPEVQVIFQHFADPVSSFLLPGVETARWREVSEDVMPWGFQFRVVETHGDLIAATRFDGKMYDAAGMPELLEEFETLLGRVVTQPDGSVRELVAGMELW